MPGPAASADPAPEIRLVPIDHPDATTLIAAVQLEYVRRYGGPDETPVDVRRIRAAGRRVLRRVRRWRAGRDGRLAALSRAGDGEPTAELKRMYVVDNHRGRGLARRATRPPRATRRGDGATRLILETGSAQPEAIALYGSAGYLPIAAFGHYADEPGAVHLGKRLDG